MLVISKLYLLVMPFGGVLVSKSVTIDQPLFQHDLVKGPFMHAESATRSCLDSSAKGFGRADTRLLNVRRSALDQ